MHNIATSWLLSHLLRISIAVRLGDADLDDDVGVQLRRIRVWAVHPRYDGFRPYFDVALITLDREANLTTTTTQQQYVSPICLPENYSHDVDKYEGDLVNVAGVITLLWILRSGQLAG